MPTPDKRMPEYQRSEKLEELLADLNQKLKGANELYLNGVTEDQPKIFIVGAHRSGSTLFMQWLAATGLVAYPTNLLSRFYGAPLVGAKVQQLLTDPKYNFRNEILDFNSDLSFESFNGKTKGALSPNEFWYFWRRFFPFKELDFLTEEEIQSFANLRGFRDEINELANLFGKPFAMKAMIMNQNIPILADQFKSAIFVWVRRDPLFTVQSAIEARKNQFGDINEWYSFKIKEYYKLKSLGPLESVVGQVLTINNSVEKGLEALSDNRKLVVQYEEFCQQPSYCFEKLVKLLEKNNYTPIDKPEYNCERSFPVNNSWRLQEYREKEVRDMLKLFQLR